MNRTSTTKRLLFSASILVLPLLSQAQERIARQDRLPTPAEQAPALQRNTPGQPGPGEVAVSRPLGYLAANVVNSIGTYTDIGTGGTRIRMPQNNDDDYSGAQVIGFPFRYRGKNFDYFVMNTNGFIVLGQEPASGPALFLSGPQNYTGGALYSTAPQDSNIIAVFNVDLTNSDSGQADFRTTISGAVGSRVRTIQWRSVKDKVGGQFSRGEFQIKLYENTNFIEFVYGNFIPAGDVDAFRSAAVGLRGKGGDVLYASKYSLNDWSRTIWLTDYSNPNGQNQHNYRGNYLADPGRTYTFTTTLQNNVGVARIEGLPSPACNQGVSDSIGVVVTNTGSARQTQVPVTFVVDRNTTQTATIPTLDSAESRTVYFYNLDFSTPGNYGVTAYVGLPNDQLRGNDTLRADSVQNIIPRAANGAVNSFEDEQSMVGWLTYNQNGDGFRWSIGVDTTYAHAGQRFLYLSNSGTGSDDWLISGCYGLVGRRRYKLRFHMANINQVGVSKIQVYALKQQSPDTTGAVLIWQQEDFNVYRTNYMDTTVRFYAMDTGAYYIGWYAYSDANQAILALDDVSLDTAAGLLPVGTQALLPAQALRAVPNPAGPRGFSIEGLTADRAEAVLYDAAGRRRTLTLRRQDGYRVDGDLPPGLYTLRVAGRSLRVVVQ